MYTNLLNTNNAGNYTPKRNFGRVEYNSGIESEQEVKSNSQKLIKESEILNSTKIPMNLKIAGKHHPSAPVAKSRKTFQAILETIKQNPELFEDITITYPDQTVAVKSKAAEKSDVGYFITMNDNSEDSTKGNSHYLKQHKKAFENYNMHLRRDPGTLINVVV